MNNFFLAIKDVLVQETVQSKINLFKTTYENFLNNKYNFDSTSTIEVFEKPSYHKICTIVKANQIKAKRNLHEQSGIAALLHSVAHIEYSAIDLALDACYRFQNLPKEYYIDWMEVASDEVRHFELITNLMQKYNISYGELEVHQGLFDASMKTLELIPRMALIPRYMEANGLDSNALIISKLKQLKNRDDIIKLFELILEEEIDHVRKGDIWYKYACANTKNFTCNYFDIVNKVHPNSFKSNKNINIDARLKAGFTQEEILILTNQK